MPGLPMEFWQPDILLEIASEASKPLALDDFTTRYQKTGFAGVRMELDALEPLKPGCRSAAKMK